MFPGRIAIGGITGWSIPGIKLMLAALLILWAVAMMPAASLAIEKDYYQFTTLTGTIGFEYSKDRIRSGKQTSSAKMFRQIYTLSLQGKIFSRRLVVYHIGMRMNRDSVNTATNFRTSQYKIRTTNYTFSTTILPRSAIPLTLLGSHETTGSTGSTDRTMTTNMYGLNWRIKLRRLPEMGLSVSRVRSVGTRVDNSNSRYKLDLKAKVGITENRILFSHENRANNYVKSKSTNTVFAYHNHTNFSKRTKLLADAIRSANSYRPGNSISDNSVNVILNSAPGPDFSQSHRYSFNSQKAAGKTEMSSYDGDVAYSITERLSTSLSLSELSFSSTAGKSKLKYNNLDTTDSLRYRLTRYLNWVGSFKYAVWQNNSPDATVNSRNHVREQFDTGLAYKRPFKGYTLSGGYRVGYLEDRVGTERGKRGYSRQRGLTQTVALGLTRVRLWNIALLNATGQYTQAKNKVRNVFTDTTYYHLGLSNTAGRKYASLMARYDKKITDSWRPSLNTWSESYGASVKSKYLKGTDLSLRADRKNTFEGRLGTLRTEKIDASAGHKRISFLGNTNFKFTADRSTTSQGKKGVKSIADQQSVTLNQTLSYFKTTDISISVRRFSLTDRVVRGERSRNTDVRLNHSRKFLGGNLDLHYSISFIKRRYLNAMEKYHIQKLAGAYTKAITSNLDWQARFSKSMVKGTVLYQYLPDETELGSTFYYRLRDWLFSADYSNKVTKSKTYKSTDNRVMFTLTREFVRIW